MNQSKFCKILIFFLKENNIYSYFKRYCHFDRFIRIKSLTLSCIIYTIKYVPTESQQYDRFLALLKVNEKKFNKLLFITIQNDILNYFNNNKNLNRYFLIKIKNNTSFKNIKDFLYDMCYIKGKPFYLIFREMEMSKYLLYEEQKFLNYFAHKLYET